MVFPIMNKLFIGRENEQKLLKEYLCSDQSEFIAVYGRRRVGKTFLIQQVIGNDYAFYAAGMHKVTMRIQLDNFMAALKKQGAKGTKNISCATQNNKHFFNQLKLWNLNFRRTRGVEVRKQSEFPSA